MAIIDVVESHLNGRAGVYETNGAEGYKTGMIPLGVRKIQILQAIVLDYVATTKPVGSERLLEIQTLNCKSATIRNEMAELSEWGYLMQPHTSSGRIPTDRGYRYYVDELMNPPAALGLEEADDARHNASKMRSDLEEILLQTCRVLTGLTSYPSLATDPVVETTRLQRIYLTEASPRHVLLVATLSTGHVAHRLVELDTAPGDSSLIRMANFVNAQVGERELGEALRSLSALEVPAELTAHAAALAKITAALLQVAQGLSERRVFLEGVNQIFRQPEFQDVERLTSLMLALEQPGALRQMLFDAQVRLRCHGGNRFGKRLCAHAGMQRHRVPLPHRRPHGGLSWRRRPYPHEL